MNDNYEYTPLYYGTPCQVKFYDTFDGMWRGGIAYRDLIFCGCCGTTLIIQDIVDDATKAGMHWDDAIIELEWLDISDVILG
jgi:hypothetical protein